jgi:cobalt-zinc-cadmium efflux system protein
MEHNHAISQKNLGIAIILNAIIFGVELVGGLLTNSLALISDAMHNLSDFFALILSYIASKIVLWNSNYKKTYGYVRVEIFVAFINSVSLVLIGGYIIYEALQRINNPEPVIGLWMLIIATVGFIANAFSTILLKKDAEHDLNAKSAYLHLLTDAIESLSVIIVGGLIYWFGWNILDPIISIAIGIFIIKSAWNIVLETVNILTEGTPKGIDINEVASAIKTFPEVKSVHHLHVWSLSSQFRALSAHIVVKDGLISKGNEIINKIEVELEHKFNINHPTLQLEVDVCKEQDIVVNINDVHN